MSYDLSNGEKNFSMQDLANIVGQNALQMQTVISTVQSTAKEVKKISDDFDDFKAETRANIRDIKENGKIEAEDVDLIKNLVNRKVIEILGLPLDVPRRKWTSEQLAYYKLYSGAVYALPTLASAIWSAFIFAKRSFSILVARSFSAFSLSVSSP